ACFEAVIEAALEAAEEGLLLRGLRLSNAIVVTLGVLDLVDVVGPVVMMLVMRTGFGDRRGDSKNGGARKHREKSLHVLLLLLRGSAGLGGQLFGFTQAASFGRVAHVLQRCRVGRQGSPFGETDLFGRLVVAHCKSPFEFMQACGHSSAADLHLTS